MSLTIQNLLSTRKLFVFLSLSLSLSMTACQTPSSSTPLPGASAPGNTQPSPSGTPGSTPASTPQPGATGTPNPAGRTALQFRVQGDPNLESFVTQQARGVCLMEVKTLQTRFTLSKPLSAAEQAQFQALGFQVNAQELTLRSKITNLKALVEGISLNLPALPSGEISGSVSLLDSQQQSMGEIQFKLTLSGAIHQAGILLKSLERTPALSGCPVLGADLTGASLVAFSGGLMLDLPPAPGPGSQPPTPAPSASSPAPNQQALGAPRNLQVAARSVDNLTLLWDFAEVPVAHAYRIYLNGVLIGNPLTSNYFTFGNLQSETSYTLGVETILNGQTSARVELQASTTSGGNQASGNFSGGGSISAPASPSTDPLVLSKLSSGIGSAGSLLTLTGSGFSTTSANQSVRFGTTLATIISATATELQVKVPNLPNGQLQVSVSKGTQNSQSLPFNLVSEGFIANLPTGEGLEDFDIASDRKGNSVVVWTTEPGTSIHGQRYDAFGNTAGTEFEVSIMNSANQISPSVAMDQDGNFVVAWDYYNEDYSNDHILSRRFNAQAIAQEEPVQVDSYLSENAETLYNLSPTVAMDGQGAFVIAWASTHGNDDNIYARRFLKDGQAVNTSEFLVNSTTSDDQVEPTIAMDDDGDFIIAWQSQQPAYSGIYMQRYNKNGIADPGGEKQVHTITDTHQNKPSVAMDSSGNAVISWSSQGEGIKARRYQTNETDLGTEFLVNTFTGDTEAPDVAMDALGGFMISWTSYDQDGDRGGIYAQRYLNTGAPSGSEQRLNTITAGNQANSAITSLFPGYYAGVWGAGGRK